MSGLARTEAKRSAEREAAVTRPQGVLEVHRERRPGHRGLRRYDEGAWVP